MSLTYAEIRDRRDDDLVQEHDELAKHTIVGVDYYLEELRRREAKRQTNSMRRLTWVMAMLTLVIAGLTAANLVVVLKLH
jgi:cytochrome c oxidase assembly factor CtaG